MENSKQTDKLGENPKLNTIENDENVESKTPKKPRRKVNPKRVRNMSKEQIILAMKKKKECNAKAHATVLRLIDFDESHEVLLECLREINQSHYQDVVEERALTKLCGYPMCSQLITITTDKTFHISIKTNKIYDLTDRKNFCSGSCFKSSNYLKEQLLTSPLWMRDQEEIPEFELLSLGP